MPTRALPCLTPSQRFVLPINDTCRIAIIGDWGTGQDAAKTVLAQMARKKPDIAIHLGDIYYSCTDFEATNYFYNIWKKTLGDTKSFTLGGNHDMFSGGGPTTICSISWDSRPFFCLRNDNFQIIALDTGLNDRQPGEPSPLIFRASGVAAGQDQDGREAPNDSTFPSSAFLGVGSLAGQNVIPKLQAQVQDLLRTFRLALGPRTQPGDLRTLGRSAARCIGHGGFPIGATELGPNVKYTEVPIVANIALGMMRMASSCATATRLSN